MGSDTTPPVINTTNHTGTYKTLQECKHDHTVRAVFDDKTARHTKTNLTDLANRLGHSGDNVAFSEAHYGLRDNDHELHMYYHDQVRCTDDCAGLVWPSNPWTNAA